MRIWNSRGKPVNHCGVSPNDQHAAKSNDSAALCQIDNHVRFTRITRFFSTAACQFLIIVRVFNHSEVARALIYTNAVTRLPVALLVTITTLTMTSAAVSAQVAPPSTPVPGGPVATFKSGVDLVTVSVAVRDSRGRVIRDLTKSDFQVIDSGIARPIKDFYSGESPISLAILLDISGSMGVGGNMDRARDAVRTVLTRLAARGDEAAFYTFDSKLQEVVNFT